MSKIIEVKASKTGKAKVTIHGTEYPLQLDDNNRAELTIYGQQYTVIGKVSKTKSKPTTKAESTSMGDSNSDSPTDPK